mmetsp:Transcript_20732/g.36896  ORF Transcript_20732/g.36896 Transcript_20732/m.36896 type:complete len:309 (+) Transcript_20732:240-1166(+)|eukprot:CAMPEP_0197523030 /NCGR_PEP_ID=MMETSP1318-20131121/8051_1 /TAXON_ID=552666 /ORGANISM="Partenskyella glossopodia, Strain RCC365" /LENGTH=308 /DNA_ID=CAMNT_0043075593 /DNA_START=228 /DNA_END=1154 /DNA_ORIENTATION=-
MTTPNAYNSFIKSTILDYENTFKGMNMVNFTRDHSDIPIFVVSVYLFIIFIAPNWLITEGKPMRKRFSAWNALLSVFSMIGASRVVPVLYKNLMEKGFKYTVCEDPRNWYLDGPSGLWTFLFIYSKIPELMDTVFLVLKKPQAPVRFLHWFHHLTVLLYCWHAYHHTIAPGIWFASMNFFVHSVMYFYYCFMIMGLKWVVQPFAQFITIIQILQMVVGMVVTATSAYYHNQGGDDACHVNGPNYRMGLAMYCSYFVLFVKLFVGKYSKPSKAKAKAAPCEATDNAGFFHNRAYSASNGNIAGLAKKNS